MVTLRFRERKHGAPYMTAIVVCPVHWSKSRLLAYCRSEHPTMTVTIQAWEDGHWPWDERAIWMVHPLEILSSLKPG